MPLRLSLYAPTGSRRVESEVEEWTIKQDKNTWLKQSRSEEKMKKSDRIGDV